LFVIVVLGLIGCVLLFVFVDWLLGVFSDCLCGVLLLCFGVCLCLITWFTVFGLYVLFACFCFDVVLVLL